MAFTKIDLSKDAWTLIANNATTITFQNASQWPMYINVETSASEPSETVGLIYRQNEGELKKAVADLSVGGGAYVYARASTRGGSVIVESDGS